MNRLIVLLALAATGTGCVVSDSPQPGDLVIYWDFARNAPAQSDGFIYYDQGTPAAGSHACSESGVDTVRLSGPDIGTMDVDCVYAGVQGVTISSVPGGATSVRLRGYRGSVLVYDSTYNIHVDGGASVAVSVVGVPGALDIFGYLAYGGGPTDYANCAAAGSPNIAFDVRDVFGNRVDSGTVGCSDPLPAIVFSDYLDLDDYYVRMQGLRLSDHAVVLDSCWLSLAHFSAQTGAGGFAGTLLTNPLPSCSTPF